MMRSFVLIVILTNCRTGEAANYFNQGRSTASKTVDQTFSISTLADVSDMWFTVESGQTYRFQFDFFFRSALVTVGLGVSLSYPAASRFGALVMIPQAADGPAGMWEGSISATDDPVVAPTVEAANTDYMGVVRGVITPTASGTIKLRARNETGATAVTIRAGSFATMESYPQ